MILENSINQEGVLPLTFTPETSSPQTLDGDALTQWVRDNLHMLVEKLHHHGALLFRGFQIAGQAQFEQVAQVFQPHLRSYSGGNSPRSRVEGKVYTSTEFPKESKLSLHNEASYLNVMPQMVFFYCEIEAQEGGQTPLADCRRVLADLPKEIKDRFCAKKVKYVNNLHGGYGFGKSWQQTFEMEDKAAVEANLKNNGYQYTWKPDGSLRTMIVCDAIKHHPVTNVEVWANQAEQWHPSGSPPEVRLALTSMFAEDDLPHSSYYADGSPIAEEDLTQIRAVMDKHETSFNWQKGDLLVCDNYLVAHGRAPFKGERRILVTMG